MLRSQTVNTMMENGMSHRIFLVCVRSGRTGCNACRNPDIVRMKARWEMFLLISGDMLFLLAFYKQNICSVI